MSDASVSLSNLFGLLLALSGCSGAQPDAARAPAPSPVTSSSSSSASTEPAASVVAPAAAAATASASPEPAASSTLPRATGQTVPPMPQGTRVLHIGDSMAGALGIALNKELAAAGVKPVLRYKTASYIPNWAGGAELGQYLAEHDPDLVLVTLGTNEMRVQDPSIRTGAIRKLVSRLGGRPCVWVAPPLWGDIGDTGLLPVIRANCAPCVYLDTTALYPDMPRLGDKTHPTMAAREEWARRVADWLARQRDPSAAERPWQFKPDAGGVPTAGDAP